MVTLTTETFESESTERVTDEFRPLEGPRPDLTTEIFESESTELVTEEFRRRAGRQPAVTFDEKQEFADSVGSLRISGLESFVQMEFSRIPAFGIWQDRPETDEELLEALGGQWTPLRDEDALSA